MKSSKLLIGMMMAAACVWCGDDSRAQSATPATAPQQAPAPQAHQPLKIVERMFPENCSRDRLSTAPLDIIMLHFCSDVIENPQNPFQFSRIEEIFTAVPVSAHYFIDRDGTVYQAVPERRVAFHAGRGQLPWFPDRVNTLNEYSIGIEMLATGSAEDMKIFMSAQAYADFAAKYPQHVGYTDAQYRALGQLIDGIRTRYPAIKFDRQHIVGHEESAGRQRRTDPGQLFDWSRIGLKK